jgi:hypothetical protein
MKAALPAVVALILASLFCWTLVSQWNLLERGYALHVQIGDGPATDAQISYAEWRKYATLATGALLAIGLILLGAQHSYAAGVLAAGLFAILSIGIMDAREYGFIGSPTSLKLVMLGSLAPLVAWLLNRTN